MPLLDLSGKPAVRYPDPLVKRVNPNGTQRYTAYQAPLVWYSAEAEGYRTSLWQGYDFAKYPYIELLLFGADYIAKLSGIYLYQDAPYAGPNGTPATLPTEMTFTEIGVATDYAFNILPYYSPIAYITDPARRPAYKQIVTGATKTNGVTVSGFMAQLSGRDWGVYVSDGGDPPEYTPAAIDTVYLDVLLNGAVIDSTSPFFRGQYIPVEDEILPSATNFPVVLWEEQLTQQIVDNGYIIPNVSFSGLDANLDVVGLWSRNGNYTPYQP
jgi:hypothetical protein